MAMAMRSSKQYFDHQIGTARCRQLGRYLACVGIGAFFRTSKAGSLTKTQRKCDTGAASVTKFTNCVPRILVGESETYRICTTRAGQGLADTGSFPSQHETCASEQAPISLGPFAPGAVIAAPEFVVVNRPRLRVRPCPRSRRVARLSEHKPCFKFYNIPFLEPEEFARLGAGEFAGYVFESAM